jgi:hypothetical protein
LKRRDFLIQGSIFGTGLGFYRHLPHSNLVDYHTSSALYQGFKNPAAIQQPFVRWWWNGDKIEKVEILRELRLLKEAGIGGVEINPIKFPSGTNDMGKHSARWLSPEWVDLVKFTIEKANELGLVCDLIVGSGWPFGAEWLQGDERSQIVSVAVKRLEGLRDYEFSLYELYREGEPLISSPYAGHSMQVLRLVLIPSPLDNTGEIIDITDKISNERIRLTTGEGNYALYALILINGFMEVINGAPGAGGPVLNHYNMAAVKKYLNTMSSAIGSESGKLRSFFTDSMELEGANWCTDLPDEFRKRRGYELEPWLPFILFRTGAMGNTVDFGYGIEILPDLSEKLKRIRYDFELTKTELLKERFVQTFINWCRENGVQSRMQAYGRGYHPLDGSLGVDIPECETWIKNGLGREMSEEDYRIGRAYSMINKYISSAAHLQGKSIISCEELTNTDRVFNETLELIKIASDQSIISGVTHAVFHGFNYSPAMAAFPGWVRYGTFLNERNTWWPYLKFFTLYRSRLTALLQQGKMYADIAILSPTEDMWSIYGAQNEPFPSMVYPAYQTLVWEAIHKNGNGCDYVSEKIIRDSDMHDGYLHYGERKYNCLFLIEIESLDPLTAGKLYDFVQTGGRIFCIGKYPQKSLGWQNHDLRDEEVKTWIAKMKNYPDRFILLNKPARDFINWYKGVQLQYKLDPYVQISQPNPFVCQVRYQANQAEILFFINSNIDNGYILSLFFSKSLTYKRQGWIWDLHSGERFRLPIHTDVYEMDLGPADSRLIIFDQEKGGQPYQPVPVSGSENREINGWALESQHINGNISNKKMENLQDLKEIPEYRSFCGTLIYRSDTYIPEDKKFDFLNLGKVYGLSELIVNGINCGVQWYGRRIWKTGNKLKTGKNSIEIKVVTTMGNYMKTLKDNPVAQYWTNEKRKDQPVLSMGLLGPVTLY